jgi:hypothetical protein
MPPPARVGRQVEPRVLTRRVSPGVILLHRPVAHDVQVTGPVVPGRDGPSDRVGEAVRAQRATGGLVDTVTNYDEVTGAGIGFVFHDRTTGSVPYRMAWS